MKLVRTVPSSGCLLSLCVSCAWHTLTPLPADFSLGAPSLKERDNICESVVRFVAAKGKTKQCFIGFENIVQGRTVHHDPTEELLKRLDDLSRNNSTQPRMDTNKHE